MSPLIWPHARAAELLDGLVQAANLVSSGASPPLGADKPDTSWWTRAGAAKRLEVVPSLVTWSETDSVITSGAPAIFEVDDGFIGLLGAGFRGARLLGPDGRTHTVPTAWLRDRLRSGIEAEHRPRIEEQLGRAGLPPQRLSRAVAVLLAERLAVVSIGPVYLLRSRIGAPLLVELREQGLIGIFAAWLLVLVLGQIVGLGAWATLGRGLLDGQVAGAWVFAWALLLGNAVVLSTAAVWLQGRFALSAGRWLKVRLLAGALRLDPDAVRHVGTGQWLGRVIESEAVEQLALGGGLGVFAGLIELLSAALLLSLGAAAGLHTGLLGLAILLTVFFAGVWYRRRRTWTASRVELTGDLVERLVGQRTRQIQLGPARWHEGEDEALDGYYSVSAAMDRVEPLPAWATPRLWQVLGVAALAPASWSGADPTTLAVTLGGLLTASAGLAKFGSSLTNLASAAIAWETVAPLFVAAAADPIPPGKGGVIDRAAPVIDTSGLVFQYPGAPPVLSGLSLVIQEGDRVLLEGPSGGGKSTLAAVLAGLRTQSAGLVLMRGLDRRTLGGEPWRRRVAYAPQFHENHVMAETLLFNLLMGRTWPPEPEEVDEAEELCRALGLGPMLDSMPSGLLQQVGEAGRRLSHGEQSRLFLARAMLQGADLVILDESFGALDPENLERALRVVLARCRTVVVLAHP